MFQSERVNVSKEDKHQKQPARDQEAFQESYGSDSLNCIFQGVQLDYHCCSVDIWKEQKTGDDVKREHECKSEISNEATQNKDSVIKSTQAHTTSMLL